MSYERSPRAVCSTTIGTKFNDLVSKCSLLTAARGYAPMKSLKLTVLVVQAARDSRKSTT